MMIAVKILLSVAIIALACLLSSVLNAKRNRRIRQFPIIFVAVVCMIIGVVVLTRHQEYASSIAGLWDYLVNAEILINNLLLVLFFVIVKLILRPTLSSAIRKRTTLENFSLTIYEYCEDYDEWFLKKQWTAFRKYAFAVVCGMVCVCGVFLGLTWALGPENSLWLLLFPCAALVVVNEIYAYLNGQTKEEYEHSILGTDAISQRVSNYYKLREILEKILPAPLLSSHTGSEFAGRESAADVIKEFSESENDIERIVAEYFESDGRYKIADVDCVQATQTLMLHRNVVFFNPFYRDLSMYLTLPVVHALLSGKKCVIVCGRSNSAEDVKTWLSELLAEYSHMRTLWRVNYLSDKEPECEVGILTFTQIYDKRVLIANQDFLHDTGFALLLEPSVMLNTSQIALSILSEEMNLNEEAPTYCICDRFTDGLVDTMSHLLHSEITDVVAMPVPRCNYTAMSWDADGDFCRQQLFDKQTRYLGNGIELSAIAVKNQVPSVTWYSETKAPIKDIKWIAGQHYSTICRYMNLPSQQKSLYEKVGFVSTLWSSPKTKEQFVVAEDELCNMFSVMRAYLSRGERQVFVNVLSENYLLRDYMRCNKQMFMSNPNAVPSLVPDYAKTERNTILKLILMMTLRKVSEDEVLKELHLVGIDTDDAYGTLLRLLRKYTFASDTLFTVQSVRTNIDEFTTTTSNLFSVTEEEFDKYFSDSLKNAYYILEEEKDEKSYIDAKLFSHVTQTILPGQFVTYDGKYYQAKYVSPQSGVVLRRASDQYDGRKYYRQVRSYAFSDDLSNSEIVSIKKIMDIEFALLRTDFSVRTTGYLELKDNHNLRTARLIDFSADPSVENYSRKYHNKNILRIHLPEANDKICFTICLLLSELFRTVYPDGWQYLAAVTRRPEDIDGMLNYVVYPAEGLHEEGDIFIVEDSDVDLGLLDSVEKNYMKFMEILADFLEWHFEKMREPASKDPVPVKVSVAEKEEKKRRNLVVRMLDRIRKLFGGKKEEPVNVDKPDKPADKPEKVETKPETQANTEESEKQEASQEYELGGEKDMAPDETTADFAPVDTEGAEYSLGNEGEDKKADLPKDTPVEEPKKNSRELHPEDDFEPPAEDDPDLVHIDGTDIFDNEGMPEDNDYLELSFQEIGLTPLTKTRYQRECYLKYGFEEIDGRIQVEDVRKYLRVRGWSNNSLTLARKRDVLIKTQLDTESENCCDFCGLPLSGVSYDRLNDGRIRCNDCSSSAISTIEEFKELFYRCLELMQDYYSVQFKVPISVRTTDAKEVAKGAGMVFRPSTDFAARVLGFAQRKHGRYSLVIENGSPRLAAIDTTVHELTHIWQYLNWNDSEFLATYGMNSKSCTAKAHDIVYEGMAMWAEIQYLYQIGETYYAAQQEAMAESRKDVYGIGFRIFREQYPLVKDSSMLKVTPFTSFPPVEPMEVRDAVRSTCTAKRCLC